MKIPAEDGSAIQSRMDVGARQTQQTTKTGKRNMGLFCFCALVLHTLSVVVGEVTIHDGPLSMTTTHPPDIGNITISPSIKVNYTLELSTTSPAVLDSTVAFTAQLLVSPNNTVPDGEFHYLWLNSADHGLNHCVGNHQAVLHRTFNGQTVEAGEFLMTVIVSPRGRQRDILAFASTLFRLTEHLNGNLKVTQDLEYQRRNNTFAINQNIIFHVNITDRFDKPDSPQYTYFWLNGSDLIHRTSHPHYELNFSEPTVLHLEAFTTAEFPLPSPSVVLLQDITDKTGSFQENLVFKESLTNCSLTRVDNKTNDQSLKLGHSVVLNITCAGSSPSAVCWNVTNVNTTLNGTCKPPSQFENRTQHQVTIPIGEVGWKTVQLTVYNDVSFQALSQNYYVYDEGTVNIPALVVPIAFIVLGIVIATVGGTYIVRLRRKRYVEVADFDFDPSISVTITGPFSSSLSAVKDFFSRIRHQNRSGRRFAPEYSWSHSMYESL